MVTLRFWCTRILPVGLFMALTLHFGNLVYLYLTVAFIQMLKVERRSKQLPHVINVVQCTLSRDCTLEQACLSAGRLGAFSCVLFALLHPG